MDIMDSHGQKLRVSLWLHDGGLGLTLNGDPNLSSVGLMPDACLWLGPPWFNSRFSLTPTVCEPKPFSVFHNILLIIYECFSVMTYDWL